MSNLNYNVYGQPETWDFSYINGGLTTDAAKALKIQKAKVPKWNYEGDAGYWTSQLRIGITAGNIKQNVPIDKTVCAVGMGKDCPFATMGYFRRRGDDEHSTDISDVLLNSVVRIGNGVVNGFLWEMRDDSSYGTYNLQSAGGGQIDEKQMEFRCWAPESNSIRNTSKQNGNYFIAPYTYYQLKTFIATVEVNVCNSADVPDAAADIKQVPTATWRPIDTWKKSYSNHKITGFRLNFARANQIINSGERFVYTRPQNSSAYAYSVPCGFGILDEIQFDDEYDYKRYMYALFAEGASWRTVIFQPFIDTSWNKSVHRVGFMGMFDAFSGNLKYLPSAVWYQIDYSDEVYEQLCRAAATFGFIFVTDDSLTLPSAMNTDNICFPVITDEGIAHGDYTRGADNLTNDLYNADSTHDKNYDPTVPVDDNTYSNQTVFNVIGAGASMNKRYLLDAANVNKLATDLFTICDTMSQNSDYSFFDSKVKANMLTQSPIESIVSLIRYPFTPTHGGTKQTVKLGRFDASAEGYPISNAIQTITFAGKSIFPRFGNCFLDYEPYTKYEVYVPFCDTVELSAADILGHTLNVRLVVDLFTGVCTGYILADSLCIETTTGNVGVNLPLTGLDTATINANIANAEANKKAAKKNYIKGHFDIITQKDKVGALWTQILGTNEDVVKKADYDLKHIETPAHTIGAASPVTAWAMDLNARIMIYYPTGDAVTNDTPPALRDLTTYAHTTGFATIDNAPLSNYNGLTVATNPILNFAATKTEKELIESALNGGVFI